MQQEAVARAREFQARARQAPTIYDIPPEELLTLPEEPSDPPEPDPSPSDTAFRREGAPTDGEPHSLAQQTQHGSADPIGGILDRFNLDSETLLILGLIFLLYNEHADHILLIALGYLLL